MNKETQTHLEKRGCILDYMAHTKCGLTVSTKLIASGRPSCPDCYEIYFGDLMALQQAAADRGLLDACRP